MTPIPSRPFWMVHGIGQRAPAFAHPQRFLAEAEARRLARAHPGIVFVVLETVSAVIARDIEVVTYKREVDDGIPF